MSRYIDAEVMEQRVREAMVNSPHMIPPLIKFIRSIPTADVMEVLRCKDCKFFCRESRCYCGEFGGIVTEDDFCSRGERKDENEQTHGC